MAGIFTRKAIAAILNDEALSPEERADQLFGLYGRALEDGYVTRSAAQAAALAAAEEAKAQAVLGDVRESPEYRELQERFDAYQARQDARVSGAFADVKPKFFDAVYDLVDRSEGAIPLEEQLAAIRERYEEYFITQRQEARLPRFGAPTVGSMPRGGTGAAREFARAWDFGFRNND